MFAAGASARDTLRCVAMFYQPCLLECVNMLPKQADGGLLVCTYTRSRRSAGAALQK